MMESPANHGMKSAIFFCEIDNIFFRQKLGINDFPFLLLCKSPSHSNNGLLRFSSTQSKFFGSFPILPTFPSTSILDG